MGMPILAFMGGDVIPAGVISAWVGTNGSIPTGWTRVTSLDGRFVKQIATSGTNPGATGGATTHTSAFDTTHTHTYSAHTHAGSWGNSGNASTSGNGEPTASAGSPLTHTSSAPSATPTGAVTATANTTAANTDPTHVTVLFIQSNGTPSGIPVNAVVWYNGAAPSGFSAYATLDNRLMKGAAGGADGGTSAGADTHTHTTAHTHPIDNHTHVISLDTSPIHSINTLGSGVLASSQHSHTVGTSGANSGQATSDSADAVSGNGDLTAPWQKMRAIQKTGAPGISAGVICMWLGTIASIPGGWKLCDGSSGTPNLSQDKFVRAAATDGTVGDTGGAATHTHSAGSGHVHTTASTHTHSLTTASAAAATTTIDCGPGGTATSTTTNHTHASVTFTSPAETTGSSSSVAATEAANSSNDPLFTGVAYIQKS
jgi:hypothetical protein